MNLEIEQLWLKWWGIAGDDTGTYYVDFVMSGTKISSSFHSDVKRRRKQP